MFDDEAAVMSGHGAVDVSAFGEGVHTAVLPVRDAGDGRGAAVLSQGPSERAAAIHFPPEAGPVHAGADGASHAPEAGTNEMVPKERADPNSKRVTERRSPGRALPKKPQGALAASPSRSAPVMADAVVGRDEPTGASSGAVMGAEALPRRHVAEGTWGCCGQTPKCKPSGAAKRTRMSFGSAPRR